MFNGATDSFTKLERKHLSIGFSIFISLVKYCLLLFLYCKLSSHIAVLYIFFVINNTFKRGVNNTIFPTSSLLVVYVKIDMLSLNHVNLIFYLMRFTLKVIKLIIQSMGEKML